MRLYNIVGLLPSLLPAETIIDAFVEHKHNYFWMLAETTERHQGNTEYSESQHLRQLETDGDVISEPCLSLILHCSLRFN